MPNETSHPTTPEIEMTSIPKDLRAELLADLKSEFINNLLSTSTIPKVVSESLVALLGNSGTTSADVIAALNLEELLQSEVSNE